MGNDGARLHKFGERAEVHHVVPVLAGGTSQVDNCVILCRSCHYSAHQGGLWSDVSIYGESARENGGKLEFASVETIAKEYPFYKFGDATRAELEQINDQTRGPD
jgi:HNH endonuclease